HIGRQLRGKRWALVSTGSDPTPDPDLISAFKRTCEYLGVEFVASVYGMEDGAFVDEQAAMRVRKYLHGEGFHCGGRPASRFIRRAAAVSHSRKPTADS